MPFYVPNFLTRAQTYGTKRILRKKTPQRNSETSNSKLDFLQAATTDPQPFTAVHIYIHIYIYMEQAAGDSMSESSFGRFGNDRVHHSDYDDDDDDGSSANYVLLLISISNHVHDNLLSFTDIITPTT